MAVAIRGFGYAARIRADFVDTAEDHEYHRWSGHQCQPLALSLRSGFLRVKADESVCLRLPLNP